MRFTARIAALALAAAGLIAGSMAFADTYPSKPIRFVVPYPPGGLTDVLARLVGQKLTERWKQPTTIDNRGGGGSTIGTEIVAKAPPDGYTILLVAPDLAINPSLHGTLPYDTLNDLAPVTLVALSPIVLVVHPSVPATTVVELIALAKSRPGMINYGSGGNGTGGHLAMELFKSMGGVDLVHVPYKGLGPAVTDLLAGQVALMFAQMPIVRAHVAAGKLRALGVAAATRSSAMPELPTIAEAALPGFEVDTWFGVVAPAGTPAEIVRRLSAEIGSIMRMPDVSERLVSQGTQPITNTPEEFRVFIRAELVKWADLVKRSRARVD